MNYKFRDLSIIEDQSNSIVLSCDSAGGIGLKDYDVVKVDQKITGYYMAHVCAVELLSQKIHPSFCVLTVSNEMNPTAKRFIDGVNNLLNELGNSFLINGSTEENMPTKTSAAGLVMFSNITKKFQPIKSKSGYEVYLIGVRKVGNDVVNDNGEIIKVNDLIKINELFDDRDIIGVGSKGIEYEIDIMARTSNLKFEFNKNLDIDLKSSGGPCSCIILSIPKDKKNKLKYINKKVTNLGYFYD